MKRVTGTFIIFLLILQTPITKAEIYKCIEHNGRITFSNSVCGDKFEKVEKIEISPNQNTYPQSDYTSKLSTTNMIINADFENGEEHWILPKDSLWVKNQGRNSSGGIAISAQKDNKRMIDVVQCINLEGYSQYLWSAEVMIENPTDYKHANRAYHNWYANEDCSGDSQWGAPYLEPKSDFGWQKLKGEPIKPAMDSKSVKIVLRQEGYLANGSIAYWDNIELYGLGKPSRKVATPLLKSIQLPELDPSINLLENGRFDSDILGWRDTNRAVWDSDIGRTNKGSVRTTVSTTGGGLGVGVMDQCIKLGKQRIYDLEIYVRRHEESNQAGGGRLRLVWFSEENCYGSHKISRNHKDIKEMQGWQKLRIKDYAPQSAVSATIDFIQSVNGSGKFVINWDDATFSASEQSNGFEHQ